MRQINGVEITPEMDVLLKQTVSSNFQESYNAKLQLATALELPLKKGGVPGDNVSFIFEMPEFEPGIAVEYPMDIVSPGTEKNYVAYAVPNTGRIPERHVEGDYIMVPTYDVATSLDWSRKYARDARWDIVTRAYQVAEGTITKKRNGDGWHTILTAAVNRGLAVYDDLATAGLFTKRAIALAKTVMRRNAGGNATSVDQGRLTHYVCSPEDTEDMRSWDLTQVDDVTRREIFISGEGEVAISKIFGVFIIDMVEFGVGQEYQLYFSNTLGGTMAAGKVEIGVGLDLMHKDSFVMPWRRQPNGQLVEMLPDPTLLRQNRDGFYMRLEYGTALLDNRRCLILLS